MFDQTTREVLDAVICALNTKKYTEKILDEHQFYVKTVENGFSGLIYSALQHDQISQELKNHLERDFLGYVSRDIKQSAAISYLDEMLNAQQVEHIFLKGSRMKLLYPESFMRAMGDIDILVKSEKMDNVRKLLSSHGMTLISRSQQHDVFKMKNKLVIEIHPELYKDFNLKYEPLIAHAWDYATIEESFKYVFDIEFELIYLLYHLAKHLDSSGIGLRSVLDIGIYATHFINQFDLKRLNQFIDQVNIRRFFDSMLYLCEVYFLFDFSTLKSRDFALDDRTTHQMTEYLTTSGIHGTGKSNNAFKTRYASNQLKKRKKMHVIFEILFPDYESMCAIYPWISKCRLLIVFGWFARWIRLIFRNTKSSTRKIKALRVDSKQIMELTEIFKEIGLS